MKNKLTLELGFIRPAFTGRDTSRGLRVNSALRHLRGIALRGIEASPLFNRYRAGGWRFSSKPTWRTFEADADAVRSVDAGVVLRRRVHVSQFIRLIRDLRVGNNADPVVEGLVREPVVLEVDVVDVGRVSRQDVGVQRRSVVWNVYTMIVVCISAGARQESKVAPFWLLARTCSVALLRFLARTCSVYERRSSTASVRVD